MIEAVGLVAATLTTTSYLPQVIQSIRTRATRDLNLLMLEMATVGLVLWLVYGVAVGSLPVIGSTVIDLAGVATLLVLKLRHG
ncbi:MAG: SemiSWEET transporter [Acidobacteria bacterium]|nr:SemiSWEET transporter [Acidobacteriota bacterium]